MLACNSSLFQLLLSICSTELIESAMYLYRATQDPYFLEVGRDMLESIEHSARTPCGYATVSSTIILLLTAFNTSVLTSNTSVLTSQIEYKLSCGRYSGLMVSVLCCILGEDSKFLSVHAPLYLQV